MNSHSILLFLFISAGLARAATQAAISQDKPPNCSDATAKSNASTKSSTCVRQPPRLTPVTSAPLSTLPPSHDNVVGRRRIPDAYPDADQDANQVPRAGLCDKS